MKSFNVLDSALDIHKNYLLEASAGTGKTFSIENIVVRLLIEKKENYVPPSLEQILVMTFTKAAANDLKGRIRTNIQSTVSAIENAIETAAPPSIDYLLPFYEKGEAALLEAKRSLERALFCFEDAHIFTLHGFCARMLRDHVLEGDVAINGRGGEEKLPHTELAQIVKDYFKIGLSSDQFSKAQVARLLKEHGGDGEKLEKSLLKFALMGKEVAVRPPYHELWDAFKAAMHRIKSTGIDPTKLHADCDTLFPCYNISGFKNCEEKIHAFIGLFEQEEWGEAAFEQLIEDGLLFVDFFAPSNRKKRGVPPLAAPLHYPDILSLFEEELKPIVEEARHPAAIEVRMAYGCRKLIQSRLFEEEKMTFDDLLTAMRTAVKNPSFAALIRSAYQGAIIDEFQDTDPVQWEIFYSLFLNDAWKGCLYIVGDPKQSIYGFRQADIYSYLDAADAVGQDNVASLDTNYRSVPALLEALNTLFSSDTAPGLIALPKRQCALPYHPVKYPKNPPESPLKDGNEALHFFIGKVKVTRSNAHPRKEAEAQLFLPYIAKEILRLHQEQNINFQQIAILVSDRYQAKHVERFLSEYKIPCALQRNGSLSESRALDTLKELVVAVLTFHDESAVKIALGGRLIGWTNRQLASIDDHKKLEEILLKFNRLQHTLLNKGFSSFFYQFLNSCWHEDALTVNERLLRQEGGDEFLIVLTQIAELIMDEQTQQHLTADTLPAFLNTFDEMHINDDSRLNIKNDPFQEAVKIITIHSSKGLEYDIVFALGLIKRTSPPPLILSVEREGCVKLDAVLDTASPEYLHNCEEIDAEKIRQLYVAMTRAKFRLYVPIFIAEGSKPPLGAASPMELLLARLGQVQTNSMEELYQRIFLTPEKAIDTFIDSHSTFSKTVLARDDLPEHCIVTKCPPSLTIPSSFSMPGKPLYLHSFTALSKHHYVKNLLEEKLPAPHNFLAEEKTPHTLPSSSDTGNLLHTILEEIPFNHPDVATFVRPYLTKTPYEEWLQPLTTMIENALSVPLDGFSLREIHHNSCFRETEFLYPCEGVSALKESNQPLGYLKGVIDLIFSHDGKYYILDWKSNWLGSSTKEYTQENLARAMNENQYYLQAALYKEAAKRYLRLIDPRPFEEIYGGAFYLFLRGIDPSPTEHAYGVIKIE